MALSQLKEQIPLRNVVVVSGKDWHIGVLGIVASRLVSMFSRPSIVISTMEDIGIGSGRSIVGVDLHRALAQVSGMLSGFGGHKMAVGLSISGEKIPLFVRALDEVVGSLMPEATATI